MGIRGYPPQKYLDAEEADEDRSPWYNWITDEVIPGKGIQQMWETPAIELIQDGETKEILGVKALTGITTGEDFHYTGGTEIYLKAKKGVILAIGGYENNSEILLNFAPHSHSAHRPAGMLTWYGSPYNTGDGIYMVEKVGAKLWHMCKKEAHSFGTAVGSEELHTGQTVTAFGTQIAGPGPGIVVNRYGKRFYNEYHFSGHSDQTRKWDYFSHKNEPDDAVTECDYPNVPFYWIFDDTTMKSGPLGRNSQWAARRHIWDWSEDNQTELGKGWFIQADTLEELGGKIVCKDYFDRVVGMDAAGLAETVSKYNQYCASGVDLDFARSAVTMEPLVTPPFYAMEICECQTNTQGGPKHDQYMQVLDAFDKPIARLYKAGEFGSIFGFLYNGGENVPEAMSTGRRAAKHAVTLEPWDA